jgi:hypothetical protein
MAAVALAFLVVGLAADDPNASPALGAIEAGLTVVFVIEFTTGFAASHNPSALEIQGEEKPASEILSAPNVLLGKVVGNDSAKPEDASLSVHSDRLFRKPGLTRRS